MVAEFRCREDLQAGGKRKNARFAVKSGKKLGLK